MADKNFYQKLGISETASAQEIKKAYRKLAKEYHPDVTGGDKAKEARFKEITEAYETLSDVKKKEAYDIHRKNPSPFAGGGSYTGTSGFEDFMRRQSSSSSSKNRVDFEDLFSSIPYGSADTDFFRSTGGERSTDLRANVEISLPEAVLGTEKTFTLEPGRAQEKRITVRIPAGVEDGEIVRVPKQGRKNSRGIVGDLLLQVNVLPHPIFRRKGNDLEQEIKIRIKQAVLGDRVEVPTLEGKVQLTIPAGTSSGQKLRLKGLGAKNRQGLRGDMYVVIGIVVPQSISPEAKGWIEKFDESTK